ncbi:MAG TPA: D-aminoacyl-tRNA deacylase [Candidatus Binataceae bacterium]|nr:D-aminoacyl-tRNA deacylase [Candidatus Binataceae bacterium]
MRAVVQRVKRAQVKVGGVVEGRIVGRIGRGLMVLLGVAAYDTQADAREIAGRIARMRIFADEAGKMNLDLAAVGGELLVVSQFTLLADTSAGRRPSFTGAAPAEQARELYQYFLSLCRETGIKTEEGEFGAMMEVELVNDGPVTFVLDSRSK